MTPFSTAVLDQVLAAERDHRRTLNALARATNTTIRTAPPAWATDRLHKLIAAFDAGEALICAHLKPSSPQPMYAAAHSGIVLCGSCYTDAARTVQGTYEDYVCDVCRSYSDDGLDTCLLQYGPLILSWGCCTGCASIAGPDA